MVASSSSSVQLPPHHQVFLNFRGKQLRNSFVSHLDKALRRDGINVFIDSKETRGKDVSILFSRIEESKIALAIFSSMYTESKWCLNELDKIMERVESRKLVVIPIFYKVTTDDVKKLEGEFGDKFWELIKKYSGEQQDKWKKALIGVPEKLGLTLDETSNEGEFIVKIVEAVIEVLSSSDVSPDLESEIPIDNPCPGEKENSVAAPDSPLQLFGIETRLKQLEEISDFKCENYKNTRRIGVIGMPGIGKTTLMNRLYDKGQEEFLRCVFLDVRQMWIDGTMDRNILITKLLENDYDVEGKVADLSPESLKTHLMAKESLVLLDNVSDKNQIEVLLGKCHWIKTGSRIFIITSDRSVIQGMVDYTYEVQRLTVRDSFHLFSHFAFRGELPTAEGNFMNFSRLFVDYAKGNPFALKILGRELNKKGETLWEEKLRDLAESPNKKIQDILQISYDGLTQRQKEMFLDVACFFRSGDEYYIRCLVESPIDDKCRIEDLAGKFLINISGGRVEMHDLLYTFGKKLSHESGRFWTVEGAVGALKKRPGADSVRGIYLDMSELKKKLPLDENTFKNMSKLRYLKFCSCCHRKCEAECKINLRNELDFTLAEIRYLYWLKFPLKRLPKNFNPKNLIDLNLSYSEIEEVWEGLKDTPKLKWVDLSHSSKLCNLSGLLNAESLQRLNLEGCTSLVQLPYDQMKRMKSLIFLNMRGCTSLRVLPPMNLISLKTLILSNCKSLENFWVISEKLETLYLDGTSICQLPTGMVKLQRLIVFNLKDCEMLRAVPECLGKLKALQELVLSGCSKLETFPISIVNMKCLQILLLDGTAIKEIPKILQLNCEKVEDLRRLRRGMDGLSSLRRLCLSRNDMIINLQTNISQLYHLKWLDLKYCKNLASISSLPPNLEILDAHGCVKLKTVTLPMALLKLMEQVQSKFIFTNCDNLEQAAKNSITTYAQRKIQLDAVRCYKEGTVSEALLITCFPGSEVPSWFNYQTFGSELKLNFLPLWCDDRLSAIVLCAAVRFPNTQDKINRFSIVCTCEFKNKRETCIRFSCTLGGGWIEPRKIDSDHVFIGYTSSSHITKHLEGSLKSQEHHRCVPTEASIKYEVRDGAGKIVNIGLSLVYEEPNHVVESNCNGTEELWSSALRCMESEAGTRKRKRGSEF